MVIKEFDITLDLIKSKQLSPIEVVQGDFETNIFNIQLTKDYSPVNLSGTTIEVLFAKSDNTTVMQDMDTGVSIVDAVQGKIKVVLNTNTIAAPGMVYAEVRIKEAGKIATTAKFNFYVRKAIVSNVKSTNEFPILEQLINDVEQLKDDIVNLQIPDGSIKDIKLSNEAGQIKERVSIIQQKVDDLEEEMNAPDYSAPQEVTDSVITLPDDVVEGQFSDVTLKGNTRRNILTENQSSVETDTTGFNAITSSETLTRDTAEKAFGNASLKVTVNGSAANQGVRTHSTKAYSGKTYTGSVYVKAPSGTAMQLMLRREASTNFAITEFTGTGVWQRVSVVLTVDADTNNLGLWVRTKNAEAVTFYVDGLMIEEGTEIKDFILGGNVVSTESVRVKSINKNLLNLVAENIYNAPSYYTPNSGQAKAIIANPAYKIINGIGFSGYFDNSHLVTNINITEDTISCTIKTSGYGLAFRFRAVPGKTYTYSKASANNDRTYMCFYTKDGEFINFVNTNSAIAPENAYWGFILFSNSASNVNITINKPQLEESSVATEYEEFKDGGEAYIDGELRSLPNGTCDEFNAITGEKRQRVSNDVILNGNSGWILVDDGLANTYRFAIVNWAEKDKAAEFTKSPANAREYNGDMPYTIGEVVSNVDTRLLTFRKDLGNLYIRVEKSKIDAQMGSTILDKFKAYLNQYPITLNYQLATPITHEGTSQSLIAYPKGHLIIECVKRVTKSYDNGIIVDTPIETIESVTKVEDGERIPIDLSKVTVAGNKLSFTITGAVKNEVYEVIYHYNGVLPTVRFSYPQNVAAAIDGNTKRVAANSKAINDFMSYQNAVNLQFDLRLVALEP